MWLIGMTMWDCFRGVLRAGRARSQQLFVLHGTIAVTIGVLVGGLFEYNLGDSEVLMIFLCVVALGYAAVRNVNVEPVPVHESIPEPHA
jgi:putative inorganic carbon (HCO3(-)) transporter